MEAERAQQVASEYQDISGGDWPKHIREAAAGLLPETADWAVHDDSGTGLSVVATDKKALYALAPVSADEGVSGVTVSRRPVEGLPWQVRVDETVVLDVDGAQLRRREWCFELGGVEELKLKTEERLAVPGIERPDVERLERFARTLARATGWDSLIATDDG